MSMHLIYTYISSLLPIITDIVTILGVIFALCTWQSIFIKERKEKFITNIDEITRCCIEHLLRVGTKSTNFRDRFNNDIYTLARDNRSYIRLSNLYKKTKEYTEYLEECQEIIKHTKKYLSEEYSHNEYNNIDNQIKILRKNTKLDT
jgi:hypothetical protein